jgi:hypothetical protein
MPVHTIDLGPAVLLHKRLLMGSLASAGLIYFEGIAAAVLVEQDHINLLVLIPLAGVMAAQFKTVHKPVRLLAADASGVGTGKGSQLARACRIHLLLALLYVLLLFLGARSGDSRIIAPLMGLLVLAIAYRPIVRLGRIADAVYPVVRTARTARVLLDCFAADLRQFLSLKLQSLAGDRKRLLSPFAAAAATGVAAGAVLAMLMELFAKPNALIAYGAGLAAIAAYYQTARRSKPLASALRASDPRPPVLILRQFADDVPSKDRFALGDRATFEHVAAAALARIGPVVCIGKPGERLQPLGAAREYVDGDWQTAVERLAREAAVVVFILGESESLLWEVRTVLAGRGTAGVLVLVPPLRETEAVRRRWQRFADATAPFVRPPGPMPQERTLAICFAGRDPVVITCSEAPAQQAAAFRTDPEYRLGLRLFRHLYAEPLRSVETLARWLETDVPVLRLQPPSRREDSGR